MDATASRPHILFIVMHDLGDWLGCYGKAPSPSPRMDAFARQGARLTRCFSTAPICCPSRAGMMGGCPPHASGMVGQVNRGWDMTLGTDTLAGDLRALGYETTLLGFSHFAQDPTHHGYDRFESVGDAGKPAAFARFLEDRAGDAPPFFCHLTFQALHRPFGDEHDADLPAQIELPPWIPDEPSLREDLACFHHDIQQADTRVGALLDTLEEAGLADDTLVVLTTDHGAALGRAKQTLLDSGLRIASLWRWPGVIEANIRVDALLSNQDYRSSLVALAGGEPPAAGTDSAGRSFAPLLAGARAHPPHQGRDAVFAEHTMGVMYKPMRAIRTARWKYILHWPPRSPPIIDPFIIKRLGFEKAERYYGHLAPEEELYDLDDDPDEMANLAHDPGHGPVIAELREKLLEHMRFWADPLLEGAVPDPSGQDTPAQTFARLWREEAPGMWRVDLPEIWQPQNNATFS